MKNVLYLIQVPFILIGVIAGTMWHGIFYGFKDAIEWWDS